jgi:hypothetical protein
MVSSKGQSSISFRSSIVQDFSARKVIENQSVRQFSVRAVGTCRPDKSPQASLKPSGRVPEVLGITLQPVDNLMSGISGP